MPAQVISHLWRVLNSTECLICSVRRDTIFLKAEFWLIMIPTNDRLIRMVMILKTLFIFIIGKIVAFIMRGNTTKIQFPGASLYPAMGRVPYFNGFMAIRPGNQLPAHTFQFQKY